MAKKMYIGVPTYKVVLERDLTYSSGTTWSFGTNIANEAGWTKGETYVGAVTIDGVTYSNITFSPDVGASWFGVYPESGDPIFEVYVATNNQFYDYSLGLDTKTSHTIILSTGNANGAARKVKKMYAGVSAVARKVKKGYVGVNGVARQFFDSGVPISTLPVGSTVKLNVNGTPMDFIIVQHGNPDSYFYDSSCDGTWLLMKDIIETTKWTTGSTNEYAKSSVHNYVNTTFFSYLDSSIQSIIKQVKIPYVQGSSGQSVKFGANGLSTKVFLLSAKEVGFSDPGSMLDDGLVLDYFNGCSNNTRIGYKNGVPTNWFTRTPLKGNSSSVTLVGTKGTASGTGSDLIWGVRPAIIIPSGADVSDGVVIG